MFAVVSFHSGKKLAQLISVNSNTAKIKFNNQCFDVDTSQLLYVDKDHKLLEVFL